MLLLIDLIEKGVISFDQARELLRHQREERPPLGRLALEAKMLSVGQIFKVLSHSADTGARFGESSITLGYMTVAQRDQLLGAQMSRQYTVDELIIEMELCTYDELRAYKDQLYGPPKQAAS